MNITVPENKPPHQDVASYTLDNNANAPFYTMDFEKLSLNNAHSDQLYNFDEASNNDIIDSYDTPPDDASPNRHTNTIYTDSTIIMKPDDVVSTSRSNTSSLISQQESLKSDSNNANRNSSPIGTPTMIASSLQNSPARPSGSPSLQHSPSFRPNLSPSIRPINNASPSLQHSPSIRPNNGSFQPYPSQNAPIQYNNGMAPPPPPIHMGTPQMRPNYYNNNNLSRQPTGFYSERPQQQYYYRPGAPPPQQMMPPQYPNQRPPPNQNYYNPNYPQQQQPMRPWNNFSTQDANYLSDSSVSVANTAGKKQKKSQFPPFTKENLEIYRNNAKNTTDPKASLDLAKFLVEGSNQLQGDDQDPKRTKRAREAMFSEAQKIVKKLANHAGMGKQGYPEAQFYLANCYGTGAMGLQVDAEKAFSLYVQGSKQNHPGCTFRAAVCYEVGAGTKKDKSHAMTYYRKAANLGDVTAMFKLGMILLKGLLHQPKNPREGISWLKRAAQQADDEHPHALHELGLCYEKEGIPSVIPDVNYARELFTQAAQYGYAPSQFKLGLAYENGFLNCPVDPRRSIAWYSKAAEQGDVEAEFALSGWYLTGAEGVLPQNDKEAYLWARKAADRGSAKAEYAVGYYTETGTGVPQNLEEAKRWYMRAAAQNYRKAMQRLTELKYGGARPQQRRQHTRDGNNTSSNSKDSECNIM